MGAYYKCMNCKATGADLRRTTCERSYGGVHDTERRWMPMDSDNDCPICHLTSLLCTCRGDEQTYFRECTGCGGKGKWLRLHTCTASHDGIHNTQRRLLVPAIVAADVNTKTVPDDVQMRRALEALERMARVWNRQ